MEGLRSGSAAFKIEYPLNAVRSNKKANSYSLINACFFFIVDFFFDTILLCGSVNIQPPLIHLLSGALPELIGC
jgi:hypothetical protein